MRRLPVLALVMLSAACGQQGAVGSGEAPVVSPAAAPSTPSSPSVEDSPGHTPGESTAPVRLTGGGTFKPYSEGAKAVVYDKKLAPEGAKADITVDSSGQETTSKLTVAGLLPDRKYGSHLHTKSCGAKPDDSGPHFQHMPAQGPSPHTAANPTNEVWLDFTTDASGAATAEAKQPWGLSPDRLPKSLVIHAEETTPTGPKAGTAGDRVACLDLRKAGA
ncbi:hypothetical protein Misp01_74590 [Microtetraspora sp. NBRC 13810]|uniref:superoxide dismutase family protein n=1 Tax=Microtetraspora sp. NBRC 13810 TaxID=3030990 RepID=UPI0024A0BC0E|nr:superoxide dismutase family protein [Microtetraspora sp. NBRC 13810]GLW12331.1 hypothetical protein Misp01_74590 [Microtetraspora sp. NBRC 13810]